jgi:hypothetical protein
MHRKTGFIRFTWLPFLLLLLLIACGGRKHIIPVNKFVDVLVDIHLADGMAIKSVGYASTYTLDSAALYEAVFNKHGVNRAQFDSTMSYYSHRPDDFNKLYNKVLARVKMLDAELAEQENNPETSTEDLVWQDSKTYALPQMGPVNRVEVSVPLREPGEYTVSAKIRAYTDDGSLNPRMSLYYYYDNNTPAGYRDSFPETAIDRDGQEKIYSVTKTLTDPKVTHIKGYIVNHSNTDSLFRKRMVVSEIKVVRKKEGKQ